MLFGSAYNFIVQSFIGIAPPVKAVIALTIMVVRLQRGLGESSPVEDGAVCR